MNKDDFVRSVHKKCRDEYGVKVPLTEVGWWVTVVMESLIDSVIDEQEVRIRGLGLFEKTISKGKCVSYNVGKGVMEEHEYKPRVKFTASNALKRAIRDEMTSEEYHEWLDITNALKTGHYVKGWELDNKTGGSGFAVRVK